MQAIIDDFRGGDKTALERAKAFCESDENKNDFRSWATLASMTAYKGRLDDAAQFYERAALLAGDSSKKKAELFFSAAVLRSKQGRNGSGYSEKKGSFCFGPTCTDSDEAEEEWKKEKHRKTLLLCESALGLNITEPELEEDLQKLASDAMEALGESEALVSFHRRLLSRNPESLTLSVNLANALLGETQNDSFKKEAIEILQRVVIQHPKSSKAWRTLAVALKNLEGEEDASSHALFFSFIPEALVAKSQIEFSPEVVALIRRIQGDDALAVVTELCERADTTTLLAAIGAHHFHGPVDDSVFEELLRRSNDQLTRDLCLSLIRDLPGVSLCTIKYAFRVLCAGHDERALELGRILLPQDVQMFTMDVGTSLGLLGDTRVVPLLIEQIEAFQRHDDDGGGDESDSDDFMMNIGAESSVLKCMYALSAYSQDPAAMEFLTASASGTEGDLGMVAKFALFSITSDASLLLNLDWSALGSSVISFLLKAVHGKEPHESAVKEKLAQIAAAKEEEEERQRVAEEVGVANWEPTLEELEQWRESGKADLSRKLVQELPNVFFSSLQGSLQNLEMCANRLKQLPNLAPFCDTLVEANFQANRLSGVMMLDAPLLLLKKLGFHGNSISGCDSSFFAGLPAVEELTLSCNEIVEIPPALSLCRNLTTLDLSRNRLTELPDVFSALTSLRILHISGNSLVRLPPSLFLLESMQSLYAYDNQIALLPSKLKWNKVDMINLSNNQLKSIPLSFFLRGCKVYCSENQPMSENTEKFNLHGERSLQEDVLRQMDPEKRERAPTGFCDFCNLPYFDFWIDVVAEWHRKKRNEDDDPTFYHATLCQQHEI